jgi:hypothetical protein
VKSTATKPKAIGKTVPTVILESDPSPDAEERLRHIATAAYYKAESRGFVPGQDMEDWLEAEAEFEEQLEQ